MAKFWELMAEQLKIVHDKKPWILKYSIPLSQPKAPGTKPVSFEQLTYLVRMSARMSSTALRSHSNLRERGLLHEMK